MTTTTIYSHGLTNKEAEQSPRITVRANNPGDYITVKFEVDGLDVTRFVSAKEGESVDALISRIVSSISQITVEGAESVVN